MSFVWPVMLVLLALVPVAVVAYRRALRRRKELTARHGALALVQAGGRQPGARRHIPPALFLAGLTILIIALARPQTTVSLPRLEGTVVLAFDVSGSMAANDLQPTRMEAAKAAARAFVERPPSSVRIGVVAFSDGGLAVQPPTNDRDLVLAAIDRLAPERGTSIGQGILAALDALVAEDAAPLLYSDLTPTPAATAAPAPAGSASSEAIVLLTDGENTAAPNPLAVAQLAAERGVRIYTVGIGSPEGTTLNIEGFNVFTQLDEAMLRQIAELTEGGYYGAADPEELRAIYDTLDLQLVVRSETTEVTALFSGLGMLALLSGALLSLIWFGRVP